MEGGCSVQPLLSGFRNPSQETNETTAKRRYRRSRSAPPVDAFIQSYNTHGLLTDPKSVFKRFHPSLRKVVMFLAFYLGIGAFCFYLVSDQINGEKRGGILDSFYFCIVTMTTVGYGDLVPDSTLSKLLSCAFAFTGMASIALILSKAADYLVEKQEEFIVKALHMHHRVGEAQILKEVEANRVKYKLCTATFLLLLLMVMGVAFLLKVERLSLLDSFYCVCSTITTLGYGDKAFSTKIGRTFAIFWILMSTICLAQFFLYIAELNTEHRQHTLAKWVLHRRMTLVDLEAADLDSDGVVGVGEFIIYKLKEMGKITQEDISVVLKEFEDLDVDQSGTLSPSDLVLAQSTPK